MSAVPGSGREAPRTAARPRRTRGAAGTGTHPPGGAGGADAAPASGDMVADPDRPPSLTSLLYEAVARLDAHFGEHAAAVGLTPSQANALHALGGPLPMRELGRRMCCEPPNVTFVVDRLQERGLVVRAPDPDDRRAKRIVLTPDGERLRADLLARLSRNPPLAAMAGPQRRALRDLLVVALGEDAWIRTRYRI